MSEHIHPIIDAHIHMDQYTSTEQARMIQDCEKWQVEAFIAVSNDLHSAQETLLLAGKYPQMKPACGFHPEQALPAQEEINQLLAYIDTHHEEFIAIGEVGLPYYSKQKNPSLEVEPYITLLEQMIIRAAHYHKPIVLHAIYEDASIVCDLLEKHHVTQAHFHWFKGDEPTIQRMIHNGYYISMTPDVLYEEKIRKLVETYPIDNIMVETDGPWPFENICKGKMTHPWMCHQSIREIAAIKNLPVQNVYERVLQATKGFYRL
ncbi:MAG TPA: TatD family hydrolase [Bacillota bacterium]|nr:TatD family hydrolase [Bacillota bacterium]